MQHLQPNTTLQGGKYRIERVLGQGGFGITYLARNTVFDVNVAIKEFFMKDENERDGSMVTIPHATKTELFMGQKEKFKKEAKRMFAIKNEHVVAVHDLFEENGTAYYVMDYVDGENLSDRLKRTGRPMSEDEVSKILPQILDALKAIHDVGIWHLDLKPANILLGKEGNVKLVDFGASKQFNTQKGGATTSTAISYTPGYAPREQMEQSYEKFGPWTDFYALGGTLYHLLTNKRPPLPTDIDDDISEDKHLALPFPSNISGKTKALILWLMKTIRVQRPKTVLEVMDFIVEESSKKAFATKPIPESVEKVSETVETMVAGEKEYKENENNDKVSEEFQGTNKTLLNYIPVHINKKWVSIFLVLAILCFIGILLPLMIEIWGEYLPVNEDWVMWGIESKQIRVFNPPCTLLFYLIKVYMLIIFYIGIRKCSMVLSYITVSCVSFEVVRLFLSIVLYWQMKEHQLVYYIVDNLRNLYDIVSCCMFVSHFAIGVYIIKCFGGTLKNFGIFLTGYSVACISFIFLQHFGFWLYAIGEYGIEMTWIIAMCWVLTRKSEIKK